MSKSPSPYTTPKVRLVDEFVPLYVYEDRKSSKVERINDIVTCISLGKNIVYYSLFPFSMKEVEAELVSLAYLDSVFMLGEPQVVYDNNELLTQRVINKASEIRRRFKTSFYGEQDVLNSLWDILTYSKYLINDKSVKTVEYNLKWNKNKDYVLLSFKEESEDWWSKTFELPFADEIIYFGLSVPEILDGFFSIQGIMRSKYLKYKLMHKYIMESKNTLRIFLERNEKPGINREWYHYFFDKF